MRRRIAAGLLAVALIWLPTVTQPPHALAASCTGWSSTLIPPPTIRVLRTYGTASGKVQTVDLKSYVKNVISHEYVTGWPVETLKAGAVAIKSYGWYYTMHYRGGTATGGCYDVRDDTADQWYRPEVGTVYADEAAAVDATWAVSIKRNGQQFLTGYWAGDHVACGTDASGVRIYQWSSKDCGIKGYTMVEILELYYGPGVVVTIPTNHPVATFFSAPAGTQVTVGSSAQIAWREETSGGATVATRSLALVRTDPVNGVCPSTGWLPVPAQWSGGATSPQSLDGLQPGSCYRLYLTLTDSGGRSSASQSGSVLVDALAPVAVFTSPALGRTTVPAGSGTVSWTETPAPGTTIAARSLVEEYAEAPRAGSCAGAQWRVAWTRSVASPYGVTGMAKSTCYRFRLTLTDSAGHKGTWASGELITPAS